MSKLLMRVLWPVLGLLLWTGCQPPMPIDPGYVAEPTTFVDVAADVGLDFRHSAFRWGVSGDPIAMMGGGVCWIDYNNDGWQDLYVVNSYALEEAGRWQTETGSLPESTLFRNEEGRFVDVGAVTGTAASIRGNGCLTADFDRNGYADLFITTSRVNLLLLNQGNGEFVESAEAAGVDAYGWHTAASAGDLNGDGWLDLVVAGYVDPNNQIEGSTMGFPNTHYGIRDLLYVSQGLNEEGQVTFSEVGIEAGLESTDLEYEYGLGTLLSDLDNDGDLDLLIANDTNPNRLYINEPVENDPAGVGFRLVEPADNVAIADTNSGMGVAAADYDQNGGVDLFITNMGDQTHSIYQNRLGFEFDNVSDGRFGVPTFGVGWTGWGTSWGDFDNDRDLDLFVSHGAIPVVDLDLDRQSAHLYLNLADSAGEATFKDGTLSSGFAEGEPVLGRGSAVADYDNDGDLDIVQASIGGDLVLWQNNRASGHWFIVEFEDPIPGTMAIVTLADGSQLRRELMAGSSYLSADAQRLHFGLGALTEIAGLEVIYPDGKTVRKGGLVADRIFVIEP